jgi:hypothetical protein
MRLILIDSSGNLNKRHVQKNKQHQKLDKTKLESICASFYHNHNY